MKRAVKQCQLSMVRQSGPTLRPREYSLSSRIRFTQTYLSMQIRMLNSTLRVYFHLPLD